MIVVMVRIPVGSPEEAEQVVERFKRRAGRVDQQPGFLGFELLRGEGECVSMTRWASREDLDAWIRSQAHAEAHAGMPMQTDRKPGEHRPGAGPMAGNVSIYEVAIPREGPA